MELVSATQAIPDGPEGIILESMLEGIAEYYSADLSRKVIDNMTERAEDCQHLGVEVFGYGLGPDGRASSTSRRRPPSATPSPESSPERAAPLWRTRSTPQATARYAASRGAQTP